MSKFVSLINAEQPVLVDFYAEWCGPCKAMKPILEYLKARLGEKARIVKVDVDKNAQVARDYKIQGVPTLILFKKGKVIWRQSGVVGTNQLEQLILKNLN